jgi:hypothetical protein
MKPNKPRYSSLFPKTLAQCIEPITRPVLKAQGLAGSRILTEWPSIVGKKLAAHSTPEKLHFAVGKKTEGTLVISVENGFAPEIQHQQPMILERLAAYFGYQAVNRINISHTYLPHRKENKPLKKKTGQLPESIANEASVVEDKELRETLQSLAKTLSKTSA